MTEDGRPDPARISRRLVLAGAAGAALAGRVPGLGAADAAAATPVTFYEAKNFGAVGDGSTDDTAALQAAIDAARDAGGGAVLVHGGTFRLSRALVLPSDVTLRGAGPGATSLKKAAGTATFSLVESAGFSQLTGRSEHAGTTRWSLQDLTLDGNRAGGAGGHGLAVYAYGFSVQNVVVKECAGRGIWSEYNRFGQDQAESVLLNVKVEHCSAGGVRWSGPHDCFWLNVIAANCGPAGMTSGSTTSGFEIRDFAAGLMVTNAHAWGLAHRYAWQIDCQGVSLVNCMGEGAEEAQVRIGGNDCLISGGLYFAARPPNDETVGIEVGSPSVPAVNTVVDTRVNGCIRGALRFVRDGGHGRYTLSVWQTGGDAVVLKPPATGLGPGNRFDIHVGGGAKLGVHGQGTDVLTGRDARLGSLAVDDSGIGFFGSSPVGRSGGWAVGGLGDRRLLRPGASEREVREVLATLIRELQRYGLLGGS